MPPGSMAVTLPFGPSTRTVAPSSATVYLTPAGRAIGFLPIRDMVRDPLRGLRVSGQTSAGPVPLQPKPPGLPRGRQNSYFKSGTSGTELLPVPDAGITRLRRGSRRQHLHGEPGGRS